MTISAPCKRYFNQIFNENSSFWKYFTKFKLQNPICESFEACEFEKSHTLLQLQTNTHRYSSNRECICKLLHVKTKGKVGMRRKVNVKKFLYKKWLHVAFWNNALNHGNVIKFVSMILYNLWFANSQNIPTIVCLHRICKYRSTYSKYFEYFTYFERCLLFALLALVLAQCSIKNILRLLYLMLMFIVSLDSLRHNGTRMLAPAVGLFLDCFAFFLS